jgi:hypothetical protein
VAERVFHPETVPPRIAAAAMTATAVFIDNS